MSHTIYDLKYHFAELGNKVGDGSSPEMSKSNKYKSGNELLVAAKSSKSADSKYLSTDLSCSVGSVSLAR